MIWNPLCRTVRNLRLWVWARCQSCIGTRSSDICQAQLAIFLLEWVFNRCPFLSVLGPKNAKKRTPQKDSFPVQLTLNWFQAFRNKHCPLMLNQPRQSGETWHCLPIISSHGTASNQCSMGHQMNPRAHESGLELLENPLNHFCESDECAALVTDIHVRFVRHLSHRCWNPCWIWCQVKLTNMATIPSMIGSNQNIRSPPRLTWCTQRTCLRIFNNFNLLLVKEFFAKCDGLSGFYSFFWEAVQRASERLASDPLRCRHQHLFVIGLCGRHTTECTTWRWYAKVCRSIDGWPSFSGWIVSHQEDPLRSCDIGDGGLAEAFSLSGLVGAWT